MGNPLDIKIGQRFGKLIVEKEVKIKNGKRHFICNCDCGEKSNPIPLYNLTTGKTISCGCVMRSRGAENFKKYNVYKKIGRKTDCFSPDGINFLFTFDTEDIDIVSKYCWYTREDGYALANDLTGRNKKVRFHRLVMSKYLNISIENLDNVDHINGNTRDNRKNNLRNISGTENTRSKVSYAKIVGESLGISKFRNSYISKLTCDGMEYTRSFKNKKDAVRYRLFLEFIFFGEKFSPQRHLFKKYNINEETANDIKI